MSQTAAVALAFAEALVASDFEAAHRMLAPALREQESPATLRAAWGEMILEDDPPPAFVEVATEMDDWPDKRPGDLGWAYVAIAGDVYSEAVTVVVTEAGEIRSIEWGRP